MGSTNKFTGLMLMLFLVAPIKPERVDLNELVNKNADVIKQRLVEFRKFMLPVPDDVFSSSIVETAKRYVPIQAVTEQCRNDSNYLLDSVLRADMWALKMMDASTKMVSGVLDGHLEDLGNFEECINIEEPGGRFRGQHCIIETRGILPKEVADQISQSKYFASRLDVTFSVCVPSTCSEHDVYTHVDLNLAAINASTITKRHKCCPEDLINLRCTTIDEDVWRTKDYVAIGVYGVIVALVVIATLFGSKSELVSTFSLSKNFNSLMDTSSKEGRITCLDGLTVVLMIPYIFLHQVMEALALPSTRFITILKVFDTPIVNILEQFFLVPDLFLLITGTLLSYRFLRKQEKGESFDKVRFMINRYFRFTPLLAVVMLYRATVMVHTSTGPLWKTATAAIENCCTNHWWAGLLHISNYIVPKEMCTVESWYVAVDLQLHLITMFFITLLYKEPKVGIAIIEACLLASVVALGLFSYFQEISEGFLTNMIFGDRHLEHDHFMHFAGMHFRAPGFLIGLALGYLIVNVKQEEGYAKIKQHFWWLGWLVSIAILVGLVTVDAYLVDPDHEFDPLLDPLFKCLQRPLTCFAFSWIIFACHFGKGGIVNQFLSYPAFRTLVRLMPGVYLTNLAVIFLQIWGLKVVPAFRLTDQFYYSAGDIGISFAIATLLHLFVELPFYRLVMYLLKDDKKGEDIPLSETTIGSYKTNN